jgi:hypothetical protein
MTKFSSGMDFTKMVNRSKLNKSVILRRPATAIAKNFQTNGGAFSTLSNSVNSKKELHLQKR